jgi:hypothetical protein
MDDFEPYPRPVSDPAADGLPETADDDSFADDELDRGRTADGPSPYPSPPDREDGPTSLNDYGTTAQERFDGERLTRRLRREQPDVDDASVALDPGPALAGDAELRQTSEQVADDSDNLEAEDAIDPRLGSEVSMFDRDVPGIPTLRTVGRLVALDEVGGDEVAFDAGVSGGGFSAEEGAMHEVSEEELDDQSEPGDPYLDERDLGPLIRTGAEQPWDAADLAVAEGRDPTPANVARAQRELDELGPAAIEKTVP